MLIQQAMGFRKVGTSIVLALLFFTLLGVSWEEEENIRRLLLSGSQVDEVIDDNLAALFWVNCELELNSLREIYEDTGLNMQATSSIPDGNTPKEKASAGENVQRDLIFLKAHSFLHPLIRQKLIDCLGKENEISSVLEEEVAPASSYLKHLGTLIFKSYAPPSRRQLTSDSGSASSPAPSPSPKPTVQHAQASPRPRHQLLEADPPIVQFFHPSAESAPPSDSVSEAKSSNQGSSDKTVIVVVVVTASLTIVVGSVTFLCCRSICCKDSRSDYKDDRPLITVTVNDYDVGSSVKSYTQDNSFKKLDSNVSDRNDATYFAGGIASAKANASTNKFAQFSDESVNTNANMPSPLLRPPPGKIGASPPGMPSLKPPPGGANPLPPERPASLRSKRSRTGPPLPLPSPSRPVGTSVPPAPRPPPPQPPVPSQSKPGPCPPPPSRAGGPPPPPRAGARPLQPPDTGAKASSSSSSDDADKAKLKPFFWDKVMATSDHSMVWDQIKSGSFQFNEEMIETLFGYAPVEKNKNEENKGSNSHNQRSQFIQLIDRKKAQNLSILLRALNVKTEEVVDALQKGKELPPDLLETLLRMAPKTDEVVKLRLYSGDLSQLGPAERFLKVLVDIPSSFKRLESLFFMSTVQEDVRIVIDSFETLEAACKEVRSSRLFLKLLEAVLKTGNRMNNGTFRGGAQAFKLDTLLKLSDVKGTDGKTTLLHFVVQEIIRSEGLRAIRAARESQSLSSLKSDVLLDEPLAEDAEENYRSLGLQAVSGLGSQLENVKKAACLDANSLTGTIVKLGNSLVKTKNFLNSEMKDVDEDNGFHQVLKAFVENVEVEIRSLLEEEKRIMGIVKKTADYFHGNAGKEEGFRLFVIIRDFLIMLDKTCREVREKAKRQDKKQPQIDDAPSIQGSKETPHQTPPLDIRQRLFPAFKDRRVGDSSSSGEED